MTCASELTRDSDVFVDISNNISRDMDTVLNRSGPSYSVLFMVPNSLLNMGFILDRNKHFLIGDNMSND